MPKTVAILQSSYIPWKGYFDIINMVDEFILFDDVQYTKRDWRSRNRIRTREGSAWLTIPVLTKGAFTQRIRDARCDGTAWRQRHWDTLRVNYSPASHFGRFSGIIRALYMDSRETSLSLVNRSFIEAVCSILGITTKITWSWEYGVIDGKTGRLVDLCVKAGAKKYISGPSARSYIDQSEFEKAGIRLEYMDYSGYPEYPQLPGPFDHYVSVIDLLFNVGEAAPEFMLSFGRGK